MKKNKEVMTRKGYKRKKEINKLWGKIKKVLIIFFIGFMSGLIYSNIFIHSDLFAKAQAKETNKVVELDQEEEKSLENQKNAELEGVEKIEELVNKCELDEVSCKIKEVADSYKIDWKLAVAIAKHETGVYTSEAFKTKNNVGGNFGTEYGSYQLLTFNSLESGINYFIKNLKAKYINLGLDTIEEIQPKYAPVGASNDPNNLNSYWVNGVYKYYKELGGK